jgi:hypothetical protein
MSASRALMCAAASWLFAGCAEDFHVKAFDRRGQTTVRVCYDLTNNEATTVHRPATLVLSTPAGETLTRPEGEPLTYDVPPGRTACDCVDWTLIPRTASAAALVRAGQMLRVQSTLDGETRTETVTVIAVTELPPITETCYQ